MSTALYIVSKSEKPAAAISAKLAGMFARECGFKLLPWMPRKFAQLLEDGYSCELLEEIIIRTSMAPRPSWAYLAAIISSCAIRGVHDLPEFITMRRVEPWEKELPL